MHWGPIRGNNGLSLNAVAGELIDCTGRLVGLAAIAVCLAFDAKTMIRLVLRWRFSSKLSCGDKGNADETSFVQERVAHRGLVTVSKGEFELGSEPRTDAPAMRDLVQECVPEIAAVSAKAMKFCVSMPCTSDD